MTLARWLQRTSSRSLGSRTGERRFNISEINGQKIKLGALVLLTKNRRTEMLGRLKSSSVRNKVWRMKQQRSRIS